MNVVRSGGLSVVLKGFLEGARGLSRDARVVGISTFKRVLYYPTASCTGRGDQVASVRSIRSYSRFRGVLSKCSNYGSTSEVSSRYTSYSMRGCYRHAFYKGYVRLYTPGRRVVRCLYGAFGCRCGGLRSTFRR